MEFNRKRPVCPRDASQSAAGKGPVCPRAGGHSPAPKMFMFFGFSRHFVQKFRKGVGGQRGLARRNPSKARDLGLFSVPFFLCPLRRMGTHFWRPFWALFGGLFVANPLPPTPFRNLRFVQLLFCPTFRANLQGHFANFRFLIKKT